MSYESYDDIPLEVILPMNIVYLCGEAVGMELEDFKSWTLKAMESQHTQSKMTLEVWEAVVDFTGDPEGYLSQDKFVSDADLELPEPNRLEVVDVQPGDVLVLTIPRQSSHEALEHFVQELQHRFPDNESLVVVDAKLEVVRPNEA